jgi:hypothetical protein
VLYSTESEDSSDDEMKPFHSKTEEKTDKSPENVKPSITFADLLPSMKQVYGTDIHVPHRNDIAIYRKYANMAVSSCVQPDLSNANGKTSTYKRLMLVQQSAFTIDNTLQVTTPFVGKSSLDAYFNYCFKGRKCPLSINPSDLNLYRRYTSGKTC